jgi:hypothetical protein
MESKGQVRDEIRNFGFTVGIVNIVRYWVQRRWSCYLTEQYPMDDGKEVVSSKVAMR